MDGEPPPDGALAGGGGGDGRASGEGVGAASALLSGAMDEAAVWAAHADDRDAAVAQAWATLRTMLGALRR